MSVSLMTSDRTDLFTEMARILAGDPPTLPRALIGRVVRPESEPKTGLETVLAEILVLASDEVQR